MKLHHFHHSDFMAHGERGSHLVDRARPQNHPVIDTSTTFSSGAPGKGFASKGRENHSLMSREKEVPRATDTITLNHANKIQPLMQRMLREDRVCRGTQAAYLSSC